MNIHRVLTLFPYLLLVVQVSTLHTPANQSSHDAMESSHDAVQSSHDAMESSLCAGNICQVKPDNMRHLQNMIQSDQSIMFDRGTFHVGMPSQTGKGFIQLENVSNVLVSGHAGGSHIECSAGTSFGLYFNNVSNVTVTGLTITNCGSQIPQYLEYELIRSSDLPCDHISCPPHFTEVTTTILILDSVNVTLSSVAVAHSSGFAVAAINTHKTKSLTYKLVINDCDISHSQMGALILNGVAVMLNHTSLSNSSMGLVSTSSYTEIKDTNISECSVSSMESGSLVLTGTVRVNQSSFQVRNQIVRIHNSTTVFSSVSRTNILAVLSVVASELYIDANSEVVFTRISLSGNSSALVAVASTVSLWDNSSLKFNSNSASEGASIFFATVETTVSIYNHSSLIFNHNLVQSAWVLFAEVNEWMAQNDAKVVFNSNTASDGGKLAEFHIISRLRLYDNTQFVLQSNYAKKGNMLVIANVFLLYNTSRLEIANNYAIDHSRIFIISGDITSHDNVHILISNNTAILESSIMLLQNSHGEVEEYSYYKSLMTEEEEEQDTRYEIKREAPTLPPTDNFPDNGNSGYDVPTLDEGSGINLNISIVDFQPYGGCDHPNECYYIGTEVIMDAGILPELILPHPTFEHRDNSKISFQHNTIMQRSVGFSCVQCRILASDSVALSFNDNTCTNSYVVLLNNATTLMQDRVTVEISHNTMSQGSSSLVCLNSMWRIGANATLSVTGNTAQNGFLILFSAMTAEFSGTLFVQDNELNEFGNLNIFNSQLHFNGRLICSGNKAESGVISADNSDIFFTNEAIFLDNSAANGGAISLVSSVMHISPNATVNFTRNQASGLGGAVYILNPRNRAVCEDRPFTVTSCSFQVLTGPQDDCEVFTLTFNQNRAGIAGNAVYGGRTSACIPSDASTYCTNCSMPQFSEIFQYNGNGDSSDLSNFTSDPTRVCFCENGVPNCFTVTRSLTVHPGELFHLSLATVGYGLGTVPGSVMARMNGQSSRSPGNSSFGSDLQYSQDIGTECRDLSYSIISEQQSQLITLAVNTRSFSRSLENVRAVVDFQLRGNTDSINPILYSPYDYIYETFFHIPTFVEVTLAQCPVGFQLVDGRCVCAAILLKNHIDMCSIVNGTPIIHRPSPYWIGLPEDNTSSILIHTQCPHDYCQPDDLNITAENPDEQCQFERSGILCGECREGLSMVLGSSECKICSNIFLILIIVFAVAGLVLVFFLTVLNMTVSVGTINGLILFANIIQSNRSTFVPQTTAPTHNVVAILSTFISWVNLDLGISTCLFDGLTTYVKTWLQFVFPLYLITIVSVIITTSYYSTRLTKLFGRNAVSVLATLILLSYTKVLRILITAFSFTTVNDAHGIHSTVWLADGNVEYFEPRHAILFIVAFLVLLLFGLPYTATLTVAPWIQRSKYYWVSSAYNKLKPFFDAYMGPYKDNCRHWTGLLLIVRVVLVVFFSSFTNTSTLGGPLLNLFLLTLSACGLLALTAAVQPYKKKMNNAIEMFYLTLLVLFSATNLYATNGDTGIKNRDYIYIVLVGAAFVFFLGTSVSHIWKRVQSHRSQRLSNLKRTEDQESAVAREQMRGEVTLSTNNTTNTMFRESVLDLSSA